MLFQTSTSDLRDGNEHTLAKLVVEGGTKLGVW